MLKSASAIECMLMQLFRCGCFCCCCCCSCCSSSCVCRYACSWLLEMCPIYWSKAVNILQPYASLVFSHVLSVLAILCRTAQPLVDFCHTHAARLLPVVSRSMLFFCVLLRSWLPFAVTCKLRICDSFLTSSSNHYQLSNWESKMWAD